MRTSRVVTVAAAFAVLTAGCGGVRTGSPAGSETTSTSPDGSTAPGQSGRASQSSTPVPTNTAERAVAGDGEPTLVTGVRFARHSGFDRIVIDVKGDLPGYRVQWAKGLTQDGSGRKIDVPGGAYLHIRLVPANAHTESGRPTWKGGPVFPANLGNVTDVVRTGDFEGRVGVGLVLVRKAGFEIRAQSGPNRLVVDVAH